MTSSPTPEPIDNLTATTYLPIDETTNKQIPSLSMNSKPHKRNNNSNATTCLPINLNPKKYTTYCMTKGYNRNSKKGNGITNNSCEEHHVANKAIKAQNVPQ